MTEKEKILVYWNLSEKYYETFGKHLPIELAFMNIEDGIKWILNELEKDEDKDYE